MATKLAAVPRQGMEDNELASLLAAHEQRSVGYYNSEIADEQAKAINYYYGIMDDLPPVDGGSSVVDHLVAIMVDNGLASVLKPFVSAEEVVSFAPRGPEDVEQAEQATEYVNYVIQCDNPGFTIFHDWFKDGLLTKIGVVKCWWEDTTRSVINPAVVDVMGLMQARQDEGYLDEQENPDGTFTVNLEQVEEDGRVKIVNVPPEEFLISPFARSIEEAPYVAHRPSNVTRSDLLEMGMDAEVVEGLPTHSTNNTEESRGQARYRDEEWFSGTREPVGSDKSQDVIGVLDEYVKCDYDGDGIAELRRVIRVADNILFNEPVDEIPFALICPCPMPHKVYGRSTADQSVQGQKVRTAIIRQTLENLYKTNNPRPVIPDGAIGPSTMEDLVDGSPGAAIRVKSPGMLDWNVVPFTAANSFQMLEAVAQDTEEQTGVQRKGNGLNSEALKKNSADTATQAAIDENSRNERAEMIARIFAETGVKRLFKLVLKLLVEHQPRARIIRLRNKFVEMDPSGWSPEMDLSISVGLGMGNRAEQIMQAETILNAMERIGQTPFAYLVDGEKVRNALKRLFTASGVKNVDDFLGEIQRDEQGKPVEPPPPPDPKQAEIQGKMELEQAKMQIKAQSDDFARQQKEAQAQADFMLKQQKQQSDFALQQQKQQNEAAMAQQKANFEAWLAQMEARLEAQLERERMAIQGQLGREKNDAISKNRSGGKLNE